MSDEVFKRTRVEDFDLAAVDRVLEENEPKHKGAWRHLDIVDILDHALEHLAVARNILRHGAPGQIQDLIKENLSNGATRSLMALTRFTKG